MTATAARIAPADAPPEAPPPPGRRWVIAADAGGFDTLAVAEVAAGGGLRTAGLGGADAGTPFELGSITKALTGMLLADLADDGVVALDDTLGEVLPDAAFADPDVAATTLEQVATHRSGLPRDLPGSLLRRVGQQLGADPFGALAPQDVLDAAAAAEIGEQDVEYSNFAFALLGQALAERTGTPYRELLRERVLDPLGMDDTVIVAPDEPLPAGAGPGRSPGGTLMSPWRGWGMAPAGGAIWSTAADLGRLLKGVVDGSAPGADAAQPRADYREDSRIGLAWITTAFDGGRALTWHNGGTSGYRTWAGFDPETGRGVALLSSTGRAVDPLGEELLGVGGEEGPGTPWPLVGVTLFLGSMGAVGVLESLPGRRAKGRPRDRLRALVAIASSLVLLWAVHLGGRWDVVPPLLWAAAVAVFAVGLVRVVDWWPRLAWTAGSSRGRRIASTVLSLALTSALAGCLAWASVEVGKRPERAEGQPPPVRQRASIGCGGRAARARTRDGQAVARVFSGIKPTGDVHLGNYLGAIARWARDQQPEHVYCVVDLHSITLPHDPAALRRDTFELSCWLLAAGLDPDVCTLFVQSHVHEHAELSWVLECTSTMGELGRMTQFKEKSEGRESIPVGLYTYPVLQAADILLYQAEEVPVGADQQQHVELTRDIAQRFNARFGETFTVPRATLPPTGARVMDLQVPGRKMSKSADSPQGTIDLAEPESATRKKIMRAVTDSGDEVRAGADKPALTNLLDLYGAATGATVEEIEQRFVDARYGDFKSELAEAVNGFLRPVRQRHDELVADPGTVHDILRKGADRARGTAAETLAVVKERVGFWRS